MHEIILVCMMTDVCCSDYQIDALEKEALVVFLWPTWTGGTATEAGRALSEYLRDLATDFRVSKDILSKLKYAVFGLGNSEYGHNWGRAAVQMDEDLRVCGGQCLVPVVIGDDSGDQDGQFREWLTSLLPALREVYLDTYGSPAGVVSGSACGGSSCGSGGCGSASAASGAIACACRSSSESNANGAGCGSTALEMDTGKGNATRQQDIRPGGSSSMGGQYLPLKQYRKLKKEQQEQEKKAEAAAARQRRRQDAAEASRGAKYNEVDVDTDDQRSRVLHASGASAGAGAVPHDDCSSDAEDGQDDDLQQTEEDLINEKELIEADVFNGFASSEQLQAVNSKLTESSGQGRRFGRQYQAGDAVVAAVDSDDEKDASTRPGAEPLADMEDLGSMLAQAKADKAVAEPAGMVSRCRRGCACDMGGGCLNVLVCAHVPYANTWSLGFVLQGKIPSTVSDREMVTPAQRKTLTKQGYKIIGSHSAVKLCRWTKAQLRGRGGCYKHTFYGISSFQCMEATPSLACANKVCVSKRHVCALNDP
jgi:hypothetical protein